MIRNKDKSGNELDKVDKTPKVIIKEKNEVKVLEREEQQKGGISSSPFYYYNKSSRKGVKTSIMTHSLITFTR
jgi:hypothetical protein